MSQETWTLSPQARPPKPWHRVASAAVMTLVGAVLFRGAGAAFGAVLLVAVVWALARPLPEWLASLWRARVAAKEQPRAIYEPEALAVSEWEAALRDRLKEPQPA